MAILTRDLFLGIIREPQLSLPALLLIPFAFCPANAQTTTTYTYDAVGRLTVAAGVNTSTTYQFDRAGNRSRVTVNSPAQALDGSFESLRVSGYQYPPASSVHKFVGLAGLAENGGAWGFPSPWQGTQVAFVQASNGQTGS